MSVHLRTKWLWIRIALQSINIFMMRLTKFILIDRSGLFYNIMYTKAHQQNLKKSWFDVHSIILSFNTELEITQNKNCSSSAAMCQKQAPIFAKVLKSNNKDMKEFYKLKNLVRKMLRRNSFFNKVSASEWSPQ